jgi:hypothetical protein
MLSAARCAPRRLRVRSLCVVSAASAWVGLNAAVWGNLFEPAPHISSSAALALAVVATVGAGLLAGRWPFVALALAVPAIAGAVGYSSDDELGAFLPIYAVIPAAIALAAGVGIGLLAPRRLALLLGAGLLAFPLPLTAFAAERTLFPYDAQPSERLPVDVRTGAFHGLSLGQPTADALRALPTGANSAAFPVGVTSLPGDATRSDGHGLSLLTEHGHVVTLFITDPRAQALGGVGVGDNLAVARARLRGLVCARSSEDVPTCAGRAAHASVLFVGDPIETITLSSIDTGWCLVSSPSCRRPRPLAPLSVR